MLFGSYVELSIALAIAALAGFLRGVTGFGSSLVLAPALSTIWGPIEATTITLLVGISASLIQVPRYIARIESASVVPISLTGLAFLLPGVLSLKFLAPGMMKHVIAYVMIAITLLMLSPRISFGNSRWLSILAGALGGLTMGATSMGGPPLVLYLMGKKGDPRQLRANIVVTVGVIELGAFAGVVLLAGVSVVTLARFALLLPGFWLAMHLSKLVAGVEHGEKYQRIVFGLLLVTGIVSAIF